MIGASIALIVLAVGAPAQAGADPADDPPPLLDTLPVEAAPDGGEPDRPQPPPTPPPIEEPEDAPPDRSRVLPAPADEDSEDGEDGEDSAPRSAVEPNEDWLMLGVDYLIIFIPVVGGPLIAPLAQGLVHKLGGEALVKNEYPNWWRGTLAGYGVFALSGMAIVGGYALAVIGSIALASSSPQAAIGAAFGGLAVMLAGVALVFVEPAVFFFFARADAEPARGARAQRIRYVTEPDEDDGSVDVRALALGALTPPPR